MPKFSYKAALPKPNLYRIQNCRVSLRCEGCKLRIEKLTSIFAPILEKQIQCVEYLCDFCLTNRKHQHSNPTLHDAMRNFAPFVGQNHGTNICVSKTVSGVLCDFCLPLLCPRLQVTRVFLGPQRKIKIQNTSQFVKKLYSPRKYKAGILVHSSPKHEGRRTPSFIKIWETVCEDHKPKDFLDFQKQNFEIEYESESIIEPPEDFRWGYLFTPN